jgi:Ner family transcriptional regulator
VINKASVAIAFYLVYCWHMNKNRPAKKPALRDWHRADIKAALEKAGWSLRRLAAHHGYASETTLVHALNRPWPKGQKLIADAIGVTPELIWPSRYERKALVDGSPDTPFLTRQSSKVPENRKQLGGSSRPAGSEVVNPSVKQAAA